MKRSTTLLSSVAGACALAAGLWSAWPAFDGIFFTQAEASDVAEVQRRINYQDRVDIAKLRLEHETRDESIRQLRAEIDYYESKIRELDDAGDGL